MPHADLAGMQCYYELQGPDDAPVLMLSNSLGTNLALWEPQMSELVKCFRVLRYDTRGHGRSSATPGPYRIPQLAQDAIALLDQMNIAQAHFCGLSMGGMIGQWLAIHNPSRLLTLVLSNTAAKIGTAETWDARIDAVTNHGMRAILPAVLERWYTASFRNRNPEVVACTQQMLASTDPRGYVANCAAIRDTDLREVVHTIGVPTLVVAGTHDPVTPPEAGQFLADNIAGARYLCLEAAHLANVEAAEEFTRGVLQFLA